MTVVELTMRLRLEMYDLYLQRTTSRTNCMTVKNYEPGLFYEVLYDTLEYIQMTYLSSFFILKFRLLSLASRLTFAIELGFLKIVGTASIFFFLSVLFPPED